MKRRLPQICIHSTIVVFLFVALLLMGKGTADATENGIFSGNVTDVAEKPVAGVEIYVYDTANTRRPADFISAPTNQRGEFQVTLPPGQYWTIARLRHGEERFGPLKPGDKHSGAPMEIEITAGENLEEDFIVADLEETSRLVVKFDTSFAKVEGLLLTKSGEPVKNAYVFANRTPARKKIPDYVSAWTGKDGTYKLFLPAGTYYFTYAYQFPPGDKFRGYQKVIIDSDQKNINIVIDE